MRLARLEQGNRRIAGTVQGEIVMIGEVAQELPLVPGQAGRRKQSDFLRRRSRPGGSANSRVAS